MLSVHRWTPTRSWTLSILTTERCQAVLCNGVVLAFPWFKAVAWVFIIGLLVTMIVMLHRM